MKKEPKKPTTAYALLALLGVLAIILGANILLDAPIHGMFFVIWLFVIPVCMHLGYSYKEIDQAMMESCKKGLGPILLLMAVGAVVGTWIACGAVPSIIYLGLKIIRPDIFLLTALLLCVIVSLASGTSWATAGTAGVAMFAIGESLGIPSGMTVGAIISGSVFGDMLSPMSDSTNVAAAAVNTDLITHCKQLAYVCAPALVIASVFYYVLGLRFGAGQFDSSYIQGLCDSISAYFHVGLPAFLPVVILLALLFFKKSAVPSMLISSLAAAAVAVADQGVPADEVLTYLWSGYSVSTGEAFLDSLLMTGSLMAPAYRDFHLHPTNLSKATNATSTVVAPLVPWNITGMYMIGLYGIGVVEYAPYSFICYITPVVAFLMVVFGFRVIPADVDLENGEKYRKPKAVKKI